METSATLNVVLKEAAIVALLEDYCKFLLKHKHVETMEDCRETVGAVLSAAMDSGEVSQNMLSHLERWLSKQTVHTDLTCCVHHIKKYMCHALGEEMEEVIQELGATGPEFEVFKKANDARRAYEEAMGQLIAEYGNQVKEISFNFVANYSKLFNAEFVAKIEKMKNC